MDYLGRVGGGGGGGAKGLLPHPRYLQNYWGRGALPTPMQKEQGQFAVSAFISPITLSCRKLVGTPKRSPSDKKFFFKCYAW